MTKKNKWMAYAALLAGGATLFHSCLGGLGGFTRGFTDGFPASNRWLNLAIDILNEELFG